MSFCQRVFDSFRVRRSVLCVGLDAALPSQRKASTIPEEYLVEGDENESRLNFCLSLVEQTADYCVAFKPNQQYVAGFTSKEHLRLSEKIRSRGCVSILDYKLNDIGDSVESALYHISRWGYDAITFNPFLGNLEETVKLAHSYPRRIGVLTLTLTSNPEATRYQKQATINDNPLYLAIAEDVKNCGGDGCVVGATGHVTDSDIRLIREAAGMDKIFLVPGIGAQAGDPKKVIENGGNVLINVSRGVIYADSPREKAKEYCDLFNSFGARLHL
jgi:orotidine 5'-phosphate decarboxylase subfamily 2